VLRALLSQTDFSNSFTSLDSSGPAIIHILNATGSSVSPTAPPSPLMLLLTVHETGPLPYKKSGEWSVELQNVPSGTDCAQMDGCC